jgi:hypothetical protein
MTCALPYETVHIGVGHAHETWFHLDNHDSTLVCSLVLALGK